MQLIRTRTPWPLKSLEATDAPLALEASHEEYFLKCLLVHYYGGQ